MLRTLTELTRTAFLIIGALFPIINALDNVPIFLSLTDGLSSESRAILARKIAINSFALLMASVLIGTHILKFFGISLPVVQVGGGLVLTVAGWTLLNRSDEEAVAPQHPQVAPKPLYLSRRAFYPLTLPLTVGPGSISVAIAVGANRPPGSEFSWYLPVAALFGCAFLALTIWVAYRFAEFIGRAIGEAAMTVIIRLSSFILLCIGVQIMWNGVSALLGSVLHPVR